MAEKPYSITVERCDRPDGGKRGAWQRYQIYRAGTGLLLEGRRAGARDEVRRYAERIARRLHHDTPPPFHVKKQAA